MNIQRNLFHRGIKHRPLFCERWSPIWSLWINQTVKIFCSGCEKIDNQDRSRRPKTVNSEAILPAFEAHPKKYHSESIRWALHLPVQCGSSHAQPYQKHTEKPNCSSGVILQFSNRLLLYYDTILTLAQSRSLADPWSAKTLQKHLYQHGSNGSTSVAQRLMCQSCTRLSSPWKKSDEHSEHRLGLLKQKFICYYIS